MKTINDLVSFSSFWRTIMLDVTSSNSAAIVIAPISGSALQNMRVVFAGGLTGVGTGSEMFQIRQANTPETFVASNIYVGFSPSTTGSYVSGAFNDTQPFGSTGSLSRWSKYWSIGVHSQGTCMYMIESQESFLLHYSTPGVIGNRGCLVGAILVGYDAASSENGRVFGMCVTGDGAPPSNFWALTATWLGHLTTANEDHMCVFDVLNGNTPNTVALAARQTSMTFAGTWPGETTTSNGTISGIGQHVVRSDGASALGFFRQIYAHQDRYMPVAGLVTSGSTNKSDSRVIGAYVSYGAVNGLGDTLLLISTGVQNAG